MYIRYNNIDNWTVRNCCFEKNNYLTHGKSVKISQEAYYVPLYSILYYASYKII
jgi:hypothetical protein